MSQGPKSINVLSGGSDELAKICGEPLKLQLQIFRFQKPYPSNTQNPTVDLPSGSSLVPAKQIKMSSIEGDGSQDRYSARAKEAAAMAHIRDVSGINDTPVRDKALTCPLRSIER